jgi:hypothetical protein
MKKFKKITRKIIKINHKNHQRQQLKLLNHKIKIIKVQINN